MTQLPPDDEQWQQFLRRNHPTPPPADNDLEDRLLDEIIKQEQALPAWRLWAVPPALAAGLLMAWSGYRTLLPLPELATSSVTLETFLEHNWNSLTGETPENLQSNTIPEDWVILANTAQ
ncbi:MAG TPA: hypothetical protein DDZ80_08965 [Cyanobacteria bacterium UBA8803]|nr:hypothetical protein [Cyanobacteria bacterium UBA9273]HBL58628.1 hypothetical protein [Cyanobacteria bacterium UBA8803]